MITHPEKLTYLRVLSEDHSSLKPSKATPFRSIQRRISFAVLLTGFVDVTFALLSLCFLVFAGLAYTVNGKATTTVSFAEDLISASKYGPTIFPILFAGIVGRSLNLIASWKLANGVTIGTLEQLTGSRTILGTISTQWKIRSVNTLALWLILLWSLSPLGGQATLRLVSINPQSYTTSLEVTALDFDTPGYNLYADAWAWRGQTSVSIFSASVVASSSVKSSARDIAGNTKIPLLEALQHTNQSGEWKLISTEEDIVYSSLMGIPVSSLPTSDKSSFVLPSSYWYWNCSQPSQRGPKTSYNHGPNFTASATYLATTDFNITTEKDRGNETTDFWAPKSPRLVTFNLVSPKTPVEINCYVTETYVEVTIECVDKSCTVNAVRLSPNRLAPVYWTILDAGEGICDQFFTEFVSASSMYLASSGAPSLVEGYLVNPQNPTGLVSDSVVWDYEGITALEMSYRISQLFNSFWLAVVAPYTYTGDFTFNSSDPVQATMGLLNVSSTQGLHYHPQQIIHCDRFWLAILIIASCAIFLLGTSTAILGMFLQTPEILDSVSSLTRDNPYIPDLWVASSAMNSDERARAMRNVEVRLGDVAADREVGHIALAAMKTEGVAPLVKGRLYD